MKVLTIEVEHSGGSLIEHFGKDKFPEMAVDNILETIKSEILENIDDHNDIQEGESLTYTIRIHRKRTEKFMDELGEFDGF